MKKKSYWLSISVFVLILIWTVYYYAMQYTGGFADLKDSIVCGIVGLICHQLFRAVSGEVAERLHYAYPEYDRNITKYTRDMYKKYTGKTGCLDSTYAADIEERREQ